MSWLFSILALLLLFFLTANFWVETGFVYVMTVQRGLEAGLWLPRDMVWTAYFWLVVGTPGDVVFNVKRGTFIFKELPQWQHGEFMFSSRVQRWVDAGPEAGWRYEEAVKWGRILNFVKPDHIKRLPEVV